MNREHIDNLDGNLYALDKHLQEEEAYELKQEHNKECWLVAIKESLDVIYPEIDNIKYLAEQYDISDNDIEELIQEL